MGALYPKVEESLTAFATVGFSSSSHSESRSEMRIKSEEWEEE